MRCPESFIPTIRSSPGERLEDSRDGPTVKSGPCEVQLALVTHWSSREGGSQHRRVYPIK